MALRVPAGRAGRPWLARRIEVAERGAEVLEQKRQALLREQARLEGTLAEATREWDDKARLAATWLRRAAVLSGERPLALARLYAGPPAQVELAWRNALGVVYPAEARVELPEPPHGLAALGGSSALVSAATAHRDALRAAARFAAAKAARDRIGTELRRTNRRLRAIERIWLPAHERALAELELSLDEGEREEAARRRWIGRRLRAAAMAISAGRTTR
jgi:vacuolar-type H+-ATPase subunit D/Vma8